VKTTGTVPLRKLRSACRRDVSGGGNGNNASSYKLGRKAR
jgi:hypothetical protein